MRAATDVNQSGEIDVKDFELAIEVSGAEMLQAKNLNIFLGSENKNKNEN